MAEVSGKESSWYKMKLGTDREMSSRVTVRNIDFILISDALHI